MKHENAYLHGDVARGGVDDHLGSLEVCHSYPSLIKCKNGECEQDDDKQKIITRHLARKCRHPYHLRNLDKTFWVPANLHQASFKPLLYIDSRCKS